MSFLPDEAFKSQGRFSMAPMVDFLFLMLLFFVTLAVARDHTHATHIELVEVDSKASSSVAAAETDSAPLKVIHIAIAESGSYQWQFNSHLYELSTPAELQHELLQQYEKGHLPADKSQTQLLLSIDQKARWEAILPAMMAIRDAGFDVYPVYQPGEAAMASSSPPPATSASSSQQ
jgi:biopolymer transport protein ExbD